MTTRAVCYTQYIGRLRITLYAVRRATAYNAAVRRSRGCRRRGRSGEAALTPTRQDNISVGYAKDANPPYISPKVSAIRLRSLRPAAASRLRIHLQRNPRTRAALRIFLRWYFRAGRLRRDVADVVAVDLAKLKLGELLGHRVQIAPLPGHGRLGPPGDAGRHELILLAVTEEVAAA